MYNPLKIAAFFLEKGLDEGVELTNMQVLKLVYIAHGWHLGLTGEALINEPVYAWQYGPVIESLYDQFRDYGSGPITSIPPINRTFKSEEFNYDSFLTKVWDVYKKYNGLQLSTLTHKQDTPWDRTIRERGVRVPIPNDYIREHYEGRLAKNKA